jgi:hypothetical protein
MELLEFRHARNVMGNGVGSQEASRPSRVDSRESRVASRESRVTFERSFVTLSEGEVSPA